MVECLKSKQGQTEAQDSGRSGKRMPQARWHKACMTSPLTKGTEVDRPSVRLCGECLGVLQGKPCCLVRGGHDSELVRRRGGCLRHLPAVSLERTEGQDIPDSSELSCSTSTGEELECSGHREQCLVSPMVLTGRRLSGCDFVCRFHLVQKRRAESLQIVMKLERLYMIWVQVTHPPVPGLGFFSLPADVFPAATSCADSILCKKGELNH
eukprot:s2186_g16.t1